MLSHLPKPKIPVIHLIVEIWHRRRQHSVPGATLPQPCSRPISELGRRPQITSYSGSFQRILFEWLIMFHTRIHARTITFWILVFSYSFRCIHANLSHIFFCITTSKTILGLVATVGYGITDPFFMATPNSIILSSRARVGRNVGPVGARNPGPQLAQLPRTWLTRESPPRRKDSSNGASQSQLVH